MGVAAQTYSNENKEGLPWFGVGDWSELSYNFGRVAVSGQSWTQRECERKFWANALPPYLDQKPYGDYLTDSLQDPSSLPLPPSDSIYIDPGRWHSGQLGRLRGAQLASGTTQCVLLLRAQCVTRQHIPKHLPRRRISGI